MLNGQPRDPFECIRHCIGNELQWVEDVHIEWDTERSIKIVIMHSYPDGIDVARWAIPVIERHMTNGYGYALSSKRVTSGSGALRSGRIENRKMTP